jgi:hypothetical protein
MEFTNLRSDPRAVCADGIEMDVVANGPEIAGGFAIYQQCFVSSTKDMAAKFVAVVEANGVGA